MKHLLSTIILLFFYLSIFAQKNIFEGVVINSQDFKPVQKASIKIKNTRQGIQTDSLGRFIIQSENQKIELEVSCVAYKKESIKLIKSQFVLIKLTPVVNDLDEFIVKPFENPAWEIIRKVRENKQLNDPNNYPEFQASMYSKTNIDLLAIKKDSLVNKKISPTLFLIENSGKIYQKNKQRKELISETFSSIPFKLPLNSLAAPDLNPFGFYQSSFNFRISNTKPKTTTNTPIIFQRIIVNPINENSFKLYDFQINDTLETSRGPQFRINFEPIKGKSFDGFKGFFDIDTTDFAITAVYAITADSLQQSTFRLKQTYSKIEDRWFPSEREMSIKYEQNKFNRTIDLKTSNYVYLKNIQTKILDKNIYFDGATKVILPGADSISNSGFEKYRMLKLDSSEALTLKNFEKYESKTSTKLINRGLNIVFGKSVRNNKLIFKPYGLSIGGIQKLALGVRVQNNLLQYPRIGINAGLAYSFGLKYQKYLLKASYYITKDRFNNATIFKKRNLERTGIIEMPTPNYGFSNPNTYNFFVKKSNIDDVEKTGFLISTRPIRYLQVQFSGFKEKRSIFWYESLIKEKKSFLLNNCQVSIRYARKETIIRTGRNERVINAFFPIIGINIKKSWSIDQTSFNFWQANMELLHQFRTKRFGITSLSILAGLEDGKIPYSHLFNNLSANNLILNSQGNINTTDLTSYAYNKYISLRFFHNFGKTIFRTKSRWFQPELGIGHSVSYSKLDDKHKISERDLKDFSDVYPELNLNISNAIRIPIRGIVIGLGVNLNAAYLSKIANKYTVRPGINLVLN